MHHFLTKLPYQNPVLRQIERWLQNGPITKNRVLPVTTLFFWKFCLSLRTSYKELICCTNNRSVHICSFWKRRTFIWWCFFPVSILNKDITETKSKIKTTACNVCSKKNKMINKEVLCKTCFSPIHRKCCKLKLGDTHDIARDKWGWECLTCISKKIPFTTEEDKEIIKNGFNSTFHCKCQTTSIFDFGKLKFWI